MNLQELSDSINSAMSEISFFASGGIHSADEHEHALSMIDELSEDYERNEYLIDLIAGAVQEYENNAPEFAAFNSRVEGVEPCIAMLKVLVEQHNLTTSDLPEIGGKSMVSQVLTGKKQMTRRHIERLAKRFNISPALFF